MSNDLLLVGAFAGVGILIWIVRWTIRSQESQTPVMSATGEDYDGLPAGVPSDGWVESGDGGSDGGGCDAGDGGGCGD